MNQVQWLQERRKGLGGSDIAAILGISPWRTPYQVYQDKRSELAPIPQNDAMEWGTRMEPTIRQWYSDTTGRLVRLPEGIIYHDKYPFMLASLDGVTDDRRVVEIKTASNGQKWGEPGTDEIPDYYMTQVQHYLIVTGFEVCDLPVSIAGSLPVLYEIHADRELHEMMIDAEAEFWQRVVDGNPPDVQTYSDAVQRFGHSDAKGIIEIGAGNVEDIQHLKEIKARITDLEAEEEKLKAEFIKLLGENGDVLAFQGENLITYKLSKGRETFDVSAFQKVHPDLYANFKKVGEPSRRFLLKI